MAKKPNHSVHCSVNSCKNHCENADYCSLNSVTIGTHEPDPKMNQCTNCLSFVNVNASEQRQAIQQTAQNSDPMSSGYESRQDYENTRFGPESGI